ncbi:MAG: metal-dependent hydrolase [Candidatus Bathyarchaeaceae archaeon]
MGEHKYNWRNRITYAVGHLSLGYLSGKLTSKVLNVNASVPLLFLVSVLPDIDLLIPGLEHRGPAHSIIIYCFLFLPVFTIYGKKAAPYFAALTQHILIGDYLTGGTQLLWPITVNWYGMGMEITSFVNIFMEWVLFLTSITVMFKAKDLWLLFQHHPSNFALSIPVLTVLLPTFLSIPLSVPLELVIPHVTYLMLFSLSTAIDLKAILTRNHA